MFMAHPFSRPSSATEKLLITSARRSSDCRCISACETALGDDSVAHHGVEVEGLGAIAQQAGANAVLATLRRSF